MTERWPCPCCGYLTLDKGPGDYEWCPVCSWEDDPGQLRMPLSPDGANGISLVEAQRNFGRFGACDSHGRSHARPPRDDEPRDAGWRPFDAERDLVESEIRWPRDGSTLYWWRPTYWTGEPSSPAENPELTPADELIQKVRQDAPETADLIDRIEFEHDGPAPFVVCGQLANFVHSAYSDGDLALAHRVLGALDTGLRGDDALAFNCVSIGFLDDHAWLSPELEAFIATWPDAIRTEIESQRAHVARAHEQARGWVNPMAMLTMTLEGLRATHRGRPLEAARELHTALGPSGLYLSDRQVADLAAKAVQPGWCLRHPIRCVQLRRLRHLRMAG